MVGSIKNHSNSDNERREDSYWENGLMVFTESYHLKRGYCCNNGCRHCPYGFTKKNPKKKITISWSGGKDSAFALYKILLSQEYQIVSLHTVIDAQSGRVGLHGIQETLIEKQAESLGIPLEKIYLPASESQDAYQTCMLKFYTNCAAQDVEGIVFGDIFLEDLRDYRINLLKTSNLLALFPLWKLNTEMIINEFLDKGFKTTICAADAALFDEHQVGNIIDKNFLKTLSPNVDPCGENGEFHTFVYDGPIFKTPVQIMKGEIVKRAYVYYKKDDLGNLEKQESVFWFQDYHFEDF